MRAGAVRRMGRVRTVGAVAGEANERMGCAPQYMSPSVFADVRFRREDRRDGYARLYILGGCASGGQTEKAGTQCDARRHPSQSKQTEELPENIASFVRHATSRPAYQCRRRFSNVSMS